MIPVSEATTYEFSYLSGGDTPSYYHSHYSMILFRATTLVIILTFEFIIRFDTNSASGNNYVGVILPQPRLNSFLRLAAASGKTTFVIILTFYFPIYFDMLYFFSILSAASRATALVIILPFYLYNPF